MKKIVVALTGASGAVYGVRLLEVLQEAGCATHAVVSRHGWQVLDYECGLGRQEIEARCSRLHEADNIAASIASGSFRTDAMVVAPCSMRTLGNIANGIADNLIGRAADVMLKEGRPLILVPRETPLSAVHLENMLKLARLGVRLAPAAPGFYHRPQTLTELVDMLVGKVCDLLGVEHTLFDRWQGQNEK